MDFQQAIQFCVDNNLIFATYRLPHADSVNLVVQKSNKPQKLDLNTELLKKRGFVIAPFNIEGSEKSYLIHPDLHYTNTNYDNFNELLCLPPNLSEQPEFENGEFSQKEFMAQVELIKEAIHNKMFDKAVLSRIKVVDLPCKSGLSKIFMSLCTEYINAFVYFFSVDGHLWMGASPEPLLCSQADSIKTVSLAGTRIYNAENLNMNNWSHKERIEQQMVTTFIENVFQNFNFRKYKKTGPYTKKAGNLVHLRTDFMIKNSKVSNCFNDLLFELHPTSAVCGLPKKPAMEYLLACEKHSRKYYAGFAGPLNIGGRLVQLFVNIRCMQILHNKLIMYVGAGITNESDAESEWIETEIKADTLLSLITI